MEIATHDVVKRVLSGDVDAYADIVRAHQQEVWRVVAYALRDREATEDLVQQVFVEAYLQLERYDPEREFGAWIRTIARNRMRNELRRQVRERQWLARYGEVLDQRLQNQEAADQAEQILQEHLEKCRQELSEPAARALSMRYDRAMGFSEIAQALGRTVNATRQLLQRVRAALRRCVEERRAVA